MQPSKWKGNVQTGVFIVILYNESSQFREMNKYPFQLNNNIN